MARRVFTVDQANAMIPQLEKTLLQLGQKTDQLEKLQRQLQILDTLWGDEVTQANNPDHGEFKQHTRGSSDLIRQIKDQVQRDILSQGLRFPAGNLDRGPIDFPTTYQGRWVYLCWERGEGEIVYWHEVNAGRQGRQKLDACHHADMGRAGDPALLDDSALDF